MSRRAQIRTQAERCCPVHPASRGGLGIRRTDPELQGPCSPRPPGDTAAGNRLGGSWCWQLMELVVPSRWQMSGEVWGVWDARIPSSSPQSSETGGWGRGAERGRPSCRGSRGSGRWVPPAAPRDLGDRKGVFTSCERAEFLFCRAFAAILGETCGLFAVERLQKRFSHQHLARSLLSFPDVPGPFWGRGTTHNEMLGIWGN